MLFFLSLTWMRALENDWQRCFFKGFQYTLEKPWHPGLLHFRSVTVGIDASEYCLWRCEPRASLSWACCLSFFSLKYIPWAVDLPFRTQAGHQNVRCSCINSWAARITKVYLNAWRRALISFFLLSSGGCAKANSPPRWDEVSSVELYPWPQDVTCQITASFSSLLHRLLTDVLYWGICGTVGVGVGVFAHWPQGPDASLCPLLFLISHGRFLVFTHYIISFEVPSWCASLCVYTYPCAPRRCSNSAPVTSHFSFFPSFCVMDCVSTCISDLGICNFSLTSLAIHLSLFEFQWYS